MSSLSVASGQTVITSTNINGTDVINVAAGGAINVSTANLDLVWNLDATGGGVTISNAGTITQTGTGATARPAIGSFGSTPLGILTINNTGTISSTQGPALGFGSVPSGGTEVVTNSGTISGGNGVAMQFGAGDDTLNLQSGSSITGRVIGGAGLNTLNLSGAGGGSIRGASEFNGPGSTLSFAGFDGWNTVNVQSGVWSLYGGGYYDTLNISAGAVFVSDELNAASNGNPSDGGLGPLHTTLTVNNSGTLRLLNPTAVQIYYNAANPLDTTSPTASLYLTGGGKMETGGFFSISANESVTSAGGFTVLNGTSLVLGAVNGAVTVNSGAILQIGYGGASILNNFDGSTYVDPGNIGVVNGAIVDNGTLTISRLDNYTISSALTGTGSLLKNGPGILTFGSSTNFAGSTTLYGGEIDNNGQLTSATQAIHAASTSAGPLVVNNTGTISGALGVNLTGLSSPTTETVTNSGSISGVASGFAVVMGSGTDTFNAVTGSSTVGRVVAGSGAGTINLSGSGTGTIYGSSEGIGAGGKAAFAGWDGFSTVNVNSGTWTLEGGGYYNTVTIASGATFVIHANQPQNAVTTPNGKPGDAGVGPLAFTPNPIGAVGSTTLTIVNNGVLNLTGDDDFFGYDPVGGGSVAYSGSGQVNYQGTGVQYFNPNLTFAVPGGLTVSSGKVVMLGALTGNVAIGAGGTLQIGGGGTLASKGSNYVDTGLTGSVNGAIVDNGVLSIARADNYIFLNPLTGTGVLQEKGPGSVTLPVTTNFIGKVLADAGTLNLAGTIATTQASTAAIGSSGGGGAGVTIVNGATVSSLTGAAVDMSGAHYAIALNNIGGGDLMGDLSLAANLRVAVLLNDFNNTLDNTGQIDGAVYMGNGNDTLHSFFGTINGVVTLGTGISTATLGSENNTVALAGGTHIVDGSGGFNTVTYAGAASGVHVSLALQDVAQSTGVGTDTLSNFRGLIGSGFNDVLTASNGSTVTGGGGADIFKAASGSVSATVTDFSHAQGDRVALTGLGFHTFADVLAAAVQSGSDTVINLGSGSLTLTGVTKTALTAQDFVLTNSTSDFAQTGQDALLFRNPTSGDWGYMSANNAGGETWHPIGSSSSDYAPLGRGDFNGDGVLDTAFRQTSTGSWGFLTINPSGGETWHQAGNASLAYDAVATGDILSNGSADIVFRNASSGDWGFMSTNGSSQVWHPIGATSSAYSVVGYGDFNGDGVFDVAFRNGQTGDWGFMSVPSTGGEVWHPVGSASVAYAAVASADFLGTGQTEIVFRNAATGDWGFMQANNSGGETWHPIGPTGPGYAVIGNGDFNGDGVQDVAFRNTTTGDWGFMTVLPTGGETWHGVGSASLAYGTI